MTSGGEDCNLAKFGLTWQIPPGKKIKEQPNWKGNYKRLRVAVRGFTEGFTGVLWTAMEELGYAAFTTGAAEYEIDFLAETISPPPLPAVSPDFFEYRDLQQWFDDVGSDLRVVKKFLMNIRFDLASIEDCGSPEHPKKYIDFHASTVIEADNGNIYRHHLSSNAGFDFPPNPWRPTPHP